MASVYQKYLKDEEGKIFSPIVSIDSIKTAGGGNIYDAIYPVGSIYISVNNINPGTLFGGVWQQLKDRFLLAAGDIYQNGTWGGSSTNTHNHFMMSGFDGSRVYFTETTYSEISRVLYKKRAFVGTEYMDIATNESHTTREDSTYNETINIMPPYFVVYMWKRNS